MELRQATSGIGSSISILFVGNGISTLLGFLYSFYAARTLRLDEYSDFISALTIASVLVLTFGPLSGIVTRFSAKYASNNDVNTIVGLNKKLLCFFFIFGTPVVLIFLIASPCLAKLFNFVVWFPLSIAILMAFAHLFLSILRGTLGGMQSFRSLSINMASEALFRFFIGALLLCFFNNAGSAISAYLFASILALGLAFYQANLPWDRKAKMSADKDSYKKLSFLFFIIIMLSAIMQNLDQISAKYYLNAEQSGIYGAAFNLSRSIIFISQPITILALPLITVRHTQGGKTAKALMLLVLAVSAVCLVPISMFYVAPSFITTALYGEKYTCAADILFDITIIRFLSLLCHTVALWCIATQRFQSLWIFVAAPLLQVWLLSLYHASMTEIIRVMICTLTVTFILLFAQYYVFLRRKHDEEKSFCLGLDGNATIL